MPAETVNQTVLPAEYAVPIASFALCVHRGAMPGAPKARFAARRIGMSYAPASRSMGPASGPAEPPAPSVQGGGSLAGKESMSTSSI